MSTKYVVLRHPEGIQIEHCIWGLYGIASLLEETDSDSSDELNSAILVLSKLLYHNMVVGSDQRAAAEEIIRAIDEDRPKLEPVGGGS